MAPGIIGKPSHFATGFPEGVDNAEVEAVAVGGSGVLVGGIGVGVDVLVGSGVEVKVGRLVAVRVGVEVGFGTKVLQDVNTIIRAVKTIAF